MHLILYTPFAGALLRALRNSVSGTFAWHCALTVLGTVAYGISDEFHQWFVPRRSPEAWDVLADGTGALLACALWWLVRVRRSKNDRGAIKGQ